jgi:hypothetical protein
VVKRFGGVGHVYSICNGYWGFDNCPESSKDNLLDACSAHAELLGCRLAD